MCGIIGQINLKGIEKSSVQKMSDCIIHRGPDSEGLFFDDTVGLGMRRLSIIDLSTGDQPIFNEDKKIMIFFNGEIYNYQPIREELIKKGHKMKTKSDTEVILHGYEEWGMDGILDKIEGMFGLTIYDTKAKKIFIARDRFGEKPIYYYKDDNHFIFGSELKSLLVTNKIPKKINTHSLYYYLVLHFVPEDLTLIEGVKKLLPSEYLTIDTQTLSFETKRYWKMKSQEEELSRLSYSDAMRLTRQMVEETVASRMIADVPVGAFLSGGIDSTVMVSIMAKHTNNLKTFSIGFENKQFDESIYAKQVAEEFGTDHHEFIFTEDQTLSIFDEFISKIDDPIGDQAMLPVYLLSKETRKHVKVVLGGEGGDETFGGYSYYSRFLDNSPFNNNKLLQMEAGMSASGFPLVANHQTSMDLIEFDSHNHINTKLFQQKFRLESDLEEFQSPLAKAQYADLFSWMPDNLLIKFDRMAMASSLEGRAPFLDSKLTQFGISLPSKFKWREGQNKAIIREAFEDIMPKNIMKRKKQGFVLPFEAWFRGKLKEILMDSTYIYQDDYINNLVFRDLVMKHIKGETNCTRLLFTIMIYKLWFKNISSF